MSARRKIERAAVATAQMDDLLLPALSELNKAISQGNGAGIYPDISRVRSAMATAVIAILNAHKICRAVDWPTDEDYDA